MFTHIFSHTELGVQALDALYRFYSSSCNSSSRELAERLGYEICEVKDLSRHTAGLMLYERFIFVAEQASPTLQEFVTAHELGHHCLARLDQSAFMGVQKTISAEAEMEVEIILDNFARAMIFGAAGVRLMTERNSHAFLRINGMSQQFASKEEFNAEKDRVQGHEIVDTAHKLLPRRSVTQRNLVLLGETLISVGKEELYKLKRPRG